MQFEKARNNDLKFIEQWVAEHPTDINTPYGENTTWPTWIFRGVWAVLSVVAVVFVPPRFRMVTGLAMLGGGAMVDQYQTEVTPDRKGWTLLHFAAESGATDVALFLIKAGAKVDIKVNDETYLDIATYYRHRDFIAACKYAQEQQGVVRNLQSELGEQGEKLEKKRGKLRVTREKLADVLCNKAEGASAPDHVKDDESSSDDDIDETLQVNTTAVFDSYDSPLSSPTPRK